MEQTELIKNIIDTLNSVCGTSYRATTKATVAHIKARLKEEFTLQDFRDVICHKNDQWGSDEEMMQYLRPETLFCAKHFESYLQAAKKAAAPVKIKRSEFVQ